MEGASGNFLDQITKLGPLLAQQEKLLKTEGERMQQLLALQEQQTKEQQALLLEVSNTSQQLVEIEKKRAALISKLKSYKTQLLVASADISKIQAAINDIVHEHVDESSGGSAAQSSTLNIIEKIQDGVYTVTHKCVQGESLTAPPEAMAQLVLEANTAIEDGIKSGAIEELPEDTIKRQNVIIDTLVPPQ